MKKFYKTITLLFTLFIMVVLVGCGGPSPEELYSDIQKEINTAETIENNYFSQFVDLKDLKAAKTNAEKVLSESDEESYKDVLAELQKQNEAATELVSKESDKYYNKTTSDDLENKYPFAVPEEDIMSQFDFKPAEKQSSAFPTWYILNEPETTDKLPTMQVDQDGYSFAPNYEFNTIDIKEVKVKFGGEEKTALVNSEMKLSTGDDTGELSGDNTAKVVGNPYYFVISQDGELTMLVHDMEGGDFYIPYHK